MENTNSKTKTMRLSVSIHADDELRVLRLRQQFETVKKRRVAMSEVIRQCLIHFENSGIVSPDA